MNQFADVLISHADFLLFCFYVVVMGKIKTRESIIATLCFALTAIYSSSDLWLAHPNWANHLVYSLCFIPAIALATTRLSFIAFSTYTIFHWLTSGLYAFSEVAISAYSFAAYATILNFCIMAALIHDRHNYDYDKHPFMVNSWIINLCRHYLRNTVTRKDTGGRNQ